jgi:threonine dehydrogenase-like Zn-dependent dehydrogenase
MPTIDFDALDYRADQTFAAAHYTLRGDEKGWSVHRDGKALLELGPGYRLLRTRACGVCSTDLARHHLPFPLPQVIGHEVIATDEQGRRYVVEINASHHARGVASDCPFCSAGLPTHCPERLTLGIHGLPGGFGPWMLVPEHACLEVPANVPDSAAVLVEPFAAALHAVQTLAPRPGERIAVLGPRRLGMLVVAALAGVRAKAKRTGGEFRIAALARDPALLQLATTFGATETIQVDDTASALPDQAFDCVIDTTGNPAALATAVRLARREVHLKSTHGQPSCGLLQLTGLVVDELALEAFPSKPDQALAGSAPWQRLRTGKNPRVAWLAQSPPPLSLLRSAELTRGPAARLLPSYTQARDGLPRADCAVASTAAEVDSAIRPIAGDEISLVRPRGSILILPDPAEPSPLLRAVAERGLRLGSSRCGDFRQALDLLAGDPELQRIGERLVTHRFAAAELEAAFATARSRGCIKAVVEHRDAGGRA